MIDGFYKAVCAALKERGYYFREKSKGSHEKWECAETGKIVLVPRDLYSKHTANGILKDAGIPKRF